jgi:peroxiredoxin
MRYIQINPTQTEAHVDPAKLPEIGETAPHIDALTATGDTFDLADHLGGYAVIWFFPRANTPG